jgi:hypothetical protein
MMDTLAEILDQLYEHPECEELYIAIGIFDASATPFTYYATLRTERGGTILESTPEENLRDAIESLAGQVSVFMKH